MAGDGGLNCCFRSREITRRMKQLSQARPPVAIAIKKEGAPTAGGDHHHNPNPFMALYVMFWKLLEIRNNVAPLATAEAQQQQDGDVFTSNFSRV